MNTYMHTATTEAAKLCTALRGGIEGIRTMREWRFRHTIRFDMIKNKPFFGRPRHHPYGAGYDVGCSVPGGRPR